VEHSGLQGRKTLLTITDEGRIQKRLKGDHEPKQYSALKRGTAEGIRFNQARVEKPIAQAMIDNVSRTPRTRCTERLESILEPDLKQWQPGFCRSSIRPMSRWPPPARMKSSGRRSALANWLADPIVHVTPRVMANRIWHYLSEKGTSRGRGGR